MYAGGYRPGMVQKIPGKGLEDEYHMCHDVISCTPSDALLAKGRGQRTVWAVGTSCALNVEDFISPVVVWS